jgi:hypothetical protein
VGISGRISSKPIPKVWLTDDRDAIIIRNIKTRTENILGDVIGKNTAFQVPTEPSRDI